MRSVWVALLLSTTVLAGCSDAPAPAVEEPQDFDDVEVEVTDETGAIRGVIVNEAIVPVAEVRVWFQESGALRETLTDHQGRFAFSKVTPGTYFLTAEKPGHSVTQFTVTVGAGEATGVTKVQLNRLFSADPFTDRTYYAGHIQCSQAGIVYASAPCITDFTSLVTGTYVPPGCQTSGCAPALRQIQDENRGFHEDLGGGWQTLVWEMMWEPSAQGTSENMGIVVSEAELKRCSCHNYMSVSSARPLRAQIDVGVDHPNSNSVEPQMIPAEGHEDLYFFVSIRRASGTPNSLLPAVALEQDFELFFTKFFYAPAPEGWSFLAGDPDPF